MLHDTTRHNPMSQTATPATARRSPSWRLIALTGAVMLAHWAVLRAAPLALASHENHDAGAGWAFATRSIAAAKAPTQTATLPEERLDAPARSRSTTQPIPRIRPAEPQTGYSKITLPPEEGSPDALEPSTPPSPSSATDATAIDEAMQVAAATPVSKATDAPPKGVSSAQSPKPPIAMAVRNYVFPPSARLKYDINGEVKGFPYHVNGELLWVQDGKTYNARMEISHFLLGSRVQTSQGQLTAHGLEPTRFGDKVRSEVAAHFERDKNKVSFSANTPDAPLLPGAQDQLSVLIQIAAMLGGEPQGFPKMSTLPFQAVGPRSSESWVFLVGTQEKLSLPGGDIAALRLSRDPIGENDPKVEIWLAPDLGYLPVRIRLTQANGDFVDQQWRATQKP